jgi:TolB-like protein/class 3 adenylate cyclase
VSSVVTANPPDFRAFLFTDIEGSSLLWLDHRATMQEAVAAHDQVMREVSTRHGGEVFKTAGDAFFVSFRRPSDAVLAACDAQIALAAQAWPPIGALRTRAAIHVGSAEQRGGDYFGPALNRCARLLALAHGGQVLVTAAVAELLESEREVRAALRRLGSHPLDDPKQSVGISQVVIDGLPQDFPPLRSPGHPDAPLLAVLAFDNLSGDPETAYFSDGVSEEILQTVARGADLKVIGRTSSFQLRGADKAIRKIVADLNATHILDGSVRRSGSKVRVAVNLIECERQTTLWSDRYDRNLTDVFALQDEIAAAVAAALKKTFAAPAAAQEVDPAAYDLYLRARELMFTGSREDRTERLTRRLGLLERAVAMAPGFARGWADLAYSRANCLRRLEPPPRGLTWNMVATAAETALRLDPGAGAAYLALSLLEPWGHYQERETLFHKALSVAPRDVEVLTRMSQLSLELGRISEALEYGERAYGLDPLFPEAATAFAGCLNAVGRTGESAALFDQLLVRWPDMELVARNAIWNAANVEDWDRFEALAAGASERGLRGAALRADISYRRNVRSPRPEYVERLLNLARDELARRGTVALLNLIIVYTVGLHEEAFQLVDRSSFAYMFDPAGPSPMAGAANLNPGSIFARAALMSRDVRFVRLCAKLGLCDYWVKSGRWPDVADQVPYDFRAEARRLAGDAKRTSGASASGRIRP